MASTSAAGPRPNDAEFASVPVYAAWLNPIVVQLTALRTFALDGTDRPSTSSKPG
jgi:hypothetical protein